MVPAGRNVIRSRSKYFTRSSDHLYSSNLSANIILDSEKSCTSRQLQTHKLPPNFSKLPTHLQAPEKSVTGDMTLEQLYSAT